MSYLCFAVERFHTACVSAYFRLVDFSTSTTTLYPCPYNLLFANAMNLLYVSAMKLMPDVMCQTEIFGVLKVETLFYFILLLPHKIIVRKTNVTVQC